MDDVAGLAGLVANSKPLGGDVATAHRLAFPEMLVLGRLQRIARAGACRHGQRCRRHGDRAARMDRDARFGVGVVRAEGGRACDGTARRQGGRGRRAQRRQERHRRRDPGTRVADGCPQQCRRWPPAASGRDNPNGARSFGGGELDREARRGGRARLDRQARRCVRRAAACPAIAVAGAACNERAGDAEGIPLDRHEAAAACVGAKIARAERGCVCCRGQRAIAAQSLRIVQLRECPVQARLCCLERLRCVDVIGGAVLLDDQVAVHEHGAHDHREEQHQGDDQRGDAVLLAPAKVHRREVAPTVALKHCSHR